MGKSMFSNYTILVVDDEVGSRDIITNSLKDRLGFKEVYVASDGKEGLEKFEKLNPDIVMTDISMPIMDGIEMVSHIKKRDREVFIVVLTAFDKSEYILSMIEMGVGHFLIKNRGLRHIEDELIKIVRILDAKREALNSRTMLENYKNIIDITNIVSATDEKGVITSVNDKFCEISKYSRDELIGKSHNIVRHPETPKAAFAQMWKDIKEGKVWHGVLKNRAKDGSTYLVDSVIAPMYDEKGKRNGYLAIRHDLTDLFMKDELIKKQALDPLTNLGSRIKLMNDIQEAKNPKLIILNIDDFSSVNETFGSSFGDELIIEVAKRLVTNAAKGVMIYRLYADEFALLIDDISSSEDWDEFISTYIEFVSKESFVVQNQEIDLSFTAGIAVGKENIINRANIAYRYAKSHKETFYFYNERLKQEDDKREENLTWNTEIKRALSEGDILSYLQPIYSYGSSAIDKYETLVRLRKKDGSIISPYFFLDVAKRSKLYSSITKKMFENTILLSKKHPDKEFSVNLSILDISNKDTIHFIYENLQKFEAGKNIVFEITEQESLDYRLIKEFAKKAKNEFDAKIAIDDFGSGYSNFEHLMEIELDYLKIDGSIIKKITTSKESIILIDAIISFSKNLNIKTIAEFVSSVEIFEKLKGMGIDYAQGYYIGEPSASVQKKPLFEE